MAEDQIGRKMGTTQYVVDMGDMYGQIATTIIHKDKIIEQKTKLGARWEQLNML
jgi:hypothetical protein